MSKSRPLQIVVYGAFGAPNTGDELILASILDHYVREDPFARITVMAYHLSISSSFVETRAAITWTSELNWYFANAVGHDKTAVLPAISELLGTTLDAKFPTPGPAILKSLRTADVFHIGGGGYFSQDFPNAIAHVMYCAMLLAVINPQCRIVFSGHTFGPFGGLNDEVREKLAAILRRASLIDLRDEQGSEWLEKQGIPFQVTCDDAFLADWIRTNHKPARSNYALLHMGGSNRSQPARFERAQAALTTAARTISAAGVEVIPISFCPIDNDAAAVAEVLEAAGISSPVIECSTLGVRGLLELFSGARFAIGTRLHVAITSMICRIPVYTVDPAPKVVALYSRFGSRDIDNGKDLAVPIEKFINRKPRSKQRTDERIARVLTIRQMKIDSLRRVTEGLDGYPWHEPSHSNE